MDTAAAARETGRRPLGNMTSCRVKFNFGLPLPIEWWNVVTRADTLPHQLVNFGENSSGGYKFSICGLKIVLVRYSCVRVILPWRFHLEVTVWNLKNAGFSQLIATVIRPSTLIISWYFIGPIKHCLLLIRELLGISLWRHLYHLIELLTWRTWWSHFFEFVFFALVYQMITSTRFL